MCKYLQEGFVASARATTFGMVQNSNRYCTEDSHSFSAQYERQSGSGASQMWGHLHFELTSNEQSVCSAPSTPLSRKTRFITIRVSLTLSGIQGISTIQSKFCSQKSGILLGVDFDLREVQHS